MGADARTLPAWEQADLPAPPPFSFRTAIAVIGPGAILLGTSIGSGEWLIGPAVTAKYGGALLWVATASIMLQVIMNMEFVRYTMYTGEPIFTGFMRTNPGRQFWGPVYAVLAFLQLGWPGWALSAATAIAAAFLGRLPGDADRQLVVFWGFLTFFATLAIVAFGSKIETTMEWAEWLMVALILIFLIFVGVFFVAPQTWGQVFQGFVSFGALPEGADWLLLGGFAAYAGAGGVINAAISNWFRDKGFGMGSAVGFIPALIGGRQIHLTHTGKVFPVTPENKRRWNEWWRYAGVDQYWVWVVGCFLGMGLPALITVQFIPPGTDITGFAVAAYQAEYLSQQLGQIMWFLTLLTGFWILFSTQLGITDAFVRLVTDITWTTSGRLRDAAGVPRELRPALWREITMLLASLFFLFFVSVTVIDQLSKNPSVLGLPSALLVGGWVAIGILSALLMGLLNRAADGEDTPSWMLAGVLFWPAALWLFFTQRVAPARAPEEARGF